MDQITFEIRSLIQIQVDMVDYPPLTTTKKWVQRGIDALENHLPRIQRYLSKQKALANLRNYRIRLKCERKISDKRALSIFKLWLKKERVKRFVFLIIEGILIPFTGILAILPGPNLFFYVPALLFFFHLASYRGLRNLSVESLDIEIFH